jgi:hypothetical protein
LYAVVIASASIMRCYGGSSVIERGIGVMERI